MPNDLTTLSSIVDLPGEAVPPESAIPPFNPQSGAEGHGVWDRYFSAVLRYKWLILLLGACGAGVGAYAARSLQLQYLAQSTLWIEVTKPSEAATGPIREGELLESYAWLELLKSFTVLDHVVREQRLFIATSPPEAASLFAGARLRDQFRTGSYTLRVNERGDQFVLLAGEAVEIQSGRVGDSIGAPIGLDWKPEPRTLVAGLTLQFSLQNPRDVSGSLSNRLTSEMAEHGNFLMISLRGPNPQRITETVNAVASRYVEVAAQLKRSKLDELTGILNEQLAYAEENLHSAEVDLENFRVNTVTLPSESATPLAPGLAMTRDPVFSNFFEMRVKREQLRDDRESIDRILRDAEKSGTALDALATLSAVGASSELQQALEQRTAKRAELRAFQARYTDEYAPVRKLIADLESLEQQTIPQLARSVALQLVTEETEAERQIGSASEELRQIPPRAIEEARLQRQVAIAQELHTTLKQRYEVARLAAAGSIPDIRILDAAIAPSAPVGDPRPFIVLGGLLGGVGIAVLGILLRDRIDPRIRYPEQLSKEMGLPIIGMVPHLKNAAGLADEKNAAEVSEAFREIRLSVLHAYGAAGPVLLTVSSAEASDGKSFVSSNLAMAFAQQGYRTVLIDGDIRRGRLHHLFECQRSPGLTDFLAGTATAVEIVQKTHFANLTLVCSGTRMEIGPELLGSNTMSQFVRDMRAQYDVVVVDSPPLGAGVDPYILGTVTGNVLLVFRTGNTNRAFANAKLSLLDRLPVRVLGAILNDVPANQKAYRYYAYLPGYRAENEQEGPHFLPAVEAAAADGDVEETETEGDVAVIGATGVEVRLRNVR